MNIEQAAMKLAWDELDERQREIYTGYAAMTEIELDRQGRGEPVAELVSQYGDPEAFGKRAIKWLVSFQKMPYGTKLYLAPQPAEPVKVPSDAEIDCVIGSCRPYLVHESERQYFHRLIRDALQQFCQPAQPVASMGPATCRAVRATAPVTTADCTCPSGDGSLRWPCPSHPPEEGQAQQDADKVVAQPANFPPAGAIDLEYTLKGLIHKVEVAGNPNQGAVPWFMCSLLRQALPHLKRLDSMEAVRPDPAMAGDELSDDDIQGLLSEYGDHHTEHGLISYDKWTLLEAGRALLKRVQPAEPKHRIGENK